MEQDTGTSVLQVKSSSRQGQILKDKDTRITLDVYSTSIVFDIATLLRAIKTK